MKRLLRWSISTLSGLLVLFLVALAFRNPLLKAFSEYRLRDVTGLRANIGKVRTTLGLGVTTVKDFRILNPEEFGPIPLVIAPELHLVLDSRPAASGNIRFKEARVHLAEFNIVRSSDGRLNLAEVERVVRARLRKRKKTRLFEADFGGIDRLYLTLGTLNFIDPTQPEPERTIHLGVTNELVTTIQSETDFHSWLGLFLVRLAVQEYFRHPGSGKEKIFDLLLDAIWRKE